MRREGSPGCADGVRAAFLQTPCRVVSTPCRARTIREHGPPRSSPVPVPNAPGLAWQAGRTRFLFSVVLQVLQVSSGLASPASPWHAFDRLALPAVRVEDDLSRVGWALRRSLLLWPMLFCTSSRGGAENLPRSTAVRGTCPVAASAEVEPFLSPADERTSRQFACSSVWLSLVHRRDEAAETAQ